MTTSANPTRNIALLAGGGLALAGIGLAAGLALRSPAPAAPEPVAVVAKAEPAANLAKAEPAANAAKADATKADAAPKADPATSSTKAERTHNAARRAPPQESAGRGVPLETQPVASTCANCGVVDSVRSFQKKGDASGVGAVAGGVLGGVLGHQVGKGSGRDAMTVIGAVGGGVAGHEIEKRANSETWFEVRVRMDDGSLRTLTQKTAPATGTRVVVDGHALRGIDSAGEEPRMMRAGLK